MTVTEIAAAVKATAKTLRMTWATEHLLCDGLDMPEDFVWSIKELLSLVIGEAIKKQK